MKKGRGRDKNLPVHNPETDRLAGTYADRGVHQGCLRIVLANYGLS